MNKLLENIHSVVAYDANKGLIRLRNNNRILFPDESGNAVVWVPSEKKLLKIKYEKLCYYMAYKKLPSKEERILHKNLDTTDYTISNLVLVLREKYLEIKEAIMNINGHMKVVPHHSDQYSYFVHYRKDKQNKRTLCSDIIEAQKLEKSLRLEFIKLITRYCYTNK